MESNLPPGMTDHDTDIAEEIDIELIPNPGDLNPIDYPEIDDELLEEFPL